MNLKRIYPQALVNISFFAANVASILAVSFILCSVAADAQPGVPVWTNRYSDSGLGNNSNDSANDIVVTSGGNVIVTGVSPYDGLLWDWVTIAYSGTGLPLWTNRYNGPQNSRDWAGYMVADGGSNVIVTGYSEDTNSLSRYTTVKYSDAGVSLWTNRIAYGVSSSAQAIGVDVSGNTFVTGSVDDGTNFYCLVAAYSNSGAALWTNRYNEKSSSGRAIAVDSNNHVVVAGDMPVGSVTDWFVIAYSGAGAPLWTNRYHDTDQPRALSVASGGTVYVTGDATDGVGPLVWLTVAYSSVGVPLWTNRFAAAGNVATMILAGSSNIFMTGTAGFFGGGDCLTVAYSSSGSLLWTNRYNGPGNGLDEGKALTVDSGGNVFVVGQSHNGTNGDYFMLAYSNAGVPLCTNRYNGPGNNYDGANAVAVDASGNVFVTGTSIGSGSYYDFATIKYASLLGGAVLTPIPLDYQIAGSQLTLSWSNAAFSLQSASSVDGGFTNIPGATTPYTNAILGPQRFFRLKGN